MPRSSGIKHICWAALLALLWAACTPYKGLPEGQHWVKENEVVFTDSLRIDKSRGLSGDLEDLAKPEETGGLKFGQWIQYRFARDTAKSFNRWLQKRIGAPYTLFDSNRVNQSTASMEQFLFNKGYFKSTVGYEVHFNEKKRAAEVTYKVERQQLTKVHEVVYEIDDPLIKSLVLERRGESAMQAGQAFDVDHLVAERSRIANTLQNSGYYGFNKQYVLFELDTLKGHQEIDIYVQILPPPKDSVHRIYTARDIYIITDFRQGADGSEIRYDTLQVSGKYLLSTGELNYIPQALLNNVAIKQGQPFSRQDYQTTLNRFTSLQVFRFVNIDIHEWRDTTGNYLDFVIKLIPAKQREINLSLNATTGSTYLLGSDIGVNYINKNLFKYTDIFNLGLSSGVELLSDSARGLFLNTVAISGEATFSFPKFLAPFRVKLPKNSNPRTDFVLRYEYFRRVSYYTQNNLTFQYGFDWSEFGFARHQLRPLELNYVRLSDTTSAFNESLERNPALRKSFQDQLILGSTYTYTKDTRHLGRKNLWIFRASFDVAGNSLYVLSLLAGQQNSEGRYTVFGRPFSQYIKPEGEVRHYVRMRNGTQLVFRLLAGVGISYGNSEVMPYVKQYIVGGSNSLRGFRVRDLGPGGFVDTVTNDATSFFNDKAGDVKIEVNMEYRFPITSVIKAALFADAGNVWLLRKDEQNFPDGEFQWDRFYREIAVNAGIGLRLDFSFFILRFDLGLPLRDPRIEANNGWRFNNYTIGNINPFNSTWRRQNMVFNLAIGYPF